MSDYEAFLDAAKGVLEDRPQSAVTELGLLDVIRGPESPEREMAGYAFLQAQGYTGASTSMLSTVALAHPALSVPQDAPLAFSQSEDDPAHVVVLGPSTPTVLLDIPGRGLVEARCEPNSVRHPIGIDDNYAGVVTVDAANGEVRVSDSDMQGLRDGITARLRLGAAAEILGASHRLIEDALVYVEARSQFGSPIARYTSLRELLAWAATERHQLGELLGSAWSGRPLSDPDVELARVAKALAGHCGLKIARATLQATGAIAFTAEHTHGAHYRRILALDSIGGSSAQLTREIGAQVRHTGKIPGVVGLDVLATSVAN